VRKGWLSVFSTLAIGFVCLASPLRAQFAYVANAGGNVSAYSIGANGALKQLLTSPFAAGNAPLSVAVDPTGKFAYVANNGSNTVSAYSIGANGALTSLGLPFTAGSGPFSVAITPLVPFASSFAKLQIAQQGFDLTESFTLGKNTNGINPVTENVTLQIGTFSAPIPAGSFKLNPNGRFAFQGVINGVSMQVQIVPLGNNIFTFKAEGTGVDLTGLTNPVTLVLTIGINSGTTTVTAQFQ
jgi:DNA-binding beta-propeller fold protein YncE